jgi:hypothetical protein
MKHRDHCQDQGTRQVVGHHELAGAEPVEQPTGQWSSDDRRDLMDQHHHRGHGRCVRVLENEPEQREQHELIGRGHRVNNQTKLGFAAGAPQIGNANPYMG